MGQVKTRNAPRHARPPQRTPGPVTLGFRVAASRVPAPAAFALRFWPLIPPLFLIPAALRRAPDLADLAGNVLGLDATLALIACITVTPLMTVVRARAAQLRWWYGIWMFELGLAGLAIALAAGRRDLAGAAAGSSASWTGLAIVVLLAPMAATSSALAQKLMGPEWKRWQRGLVWLVWAFVALHLVSLRAWPASLGFFAASAPLVMFRSPRIRKSVRAWRAGRYSAGGWWIALAVALVSYACGVTILVTEQVLACARSAGAA